MMLHGKPNNPHTKGEKAKDKMRTRLRACARGQNYLPKDACSIPVPSCLLPSMQESSSGSSGDESDYSEPQPKKLRSANVLSWQENMVNIKQRDSYILQHSMWTDCTFCVGQEKEIFKCHRLFLAKTSPVFEAMLYGDLYKSGEVINLSDTSPAAFRTLLQYIYEGSLNLNDVATICEFLYMAKKYMFGPIITSHLRAYIWENMYPDNLWNVLEFSLINDEPELYKSALKAICYDLEASLAHPSFLEVSDMALLYVIQQEIVHQGKEINLFEAIMTWARNQVEEEDDVDSLREVLEPFIPHIRFLSMKPDEFITGPSKTEIFADSDKFSILANLILPNDCPLPDFVNPKMKCDYVDNMFYVLGDRGTSVQQSLSTPSIFDTLSSIEFTRQEFPIIKLLSCQVPTQTDRYDKAINSDKYLETFHVYIYNKTKNEMIDAVQFIDNVEYNSTAISVFRNPADLSAITDTDVLQVKVIYHVTGQYAKFKAFNPTTFKSHPLYYKLKVIHRQSKYLQIVGHE